MSHRTLRFRSNRFAQPDASGDRTSPIPCGQDLSEWIRQQLQAQDWRLSPPRVAGPAWRMDCLRGEERRQILVGLDPDGWRVTILRPRTLLQSLLGRDASADARLESALQAAIVREPAILGPRWLDSDAAGHGLLAIARG